MSPNWHSSSPRGIRGCVICNGRGLTDLGSGYRAEKNSLLIQHGTFDRPGIRESAVHSWRGLNSDSSLTGTPEERLFDVHSTFIFPSAASLLSPSYPLYSCPILTFFFPHFLHFSMLYLTPFGLLLFSTIVTYYLLSIC